MPFTRGPPGSPGGLGRRLFRRRRGNVALLQRDRLPGPASRTSDSWTLADALVASGRFDVFPNVQIPFAKFKFCAMRAKPVGIVGIRIVAEQATAGINRRGPPSVSERRLRRDLVLRDDGFGPREIFQKALAG